MTAELANVRVPVSEKELERRVAILKRFRELLIQQRDRFRNYLVVLERQQTSIESANAEQILAHVEVEEQIVADIFSIQKVIEPLEAMYQAAFQTAEKYPQDDVPSLKAALEDLKQEAIIRSSHNRNLLSARMAEIRSEINTLRNNPFTAGARQHVFHNYNSATMVDIRG